MKPKNLHQEEGYEDVDRPLIFEWPTDFPYQGEPEYEDGPLFKDELIEKTFNPKQERWPKGLPGIGGEWKPKGAPEAMNGMIQDIFSGLEGDHPKAAEVASFLQKHTADTDWSQFKSVSDALSVMKSLMKSGKIVSETAGDKDLSRRFGFAVRKLDAASSKSRLAGDAGVDRNADFTSAAEQALGRKLNDEIPEKKGVPKRVVGLPGKKEEESPLLHPQYGYPFVPKNGWVRRRGSGVVEVRTRGGHSTGPTVPVGRVWRESKGKWLNDKSDIVFPTEEEAGKDLYHRAQEQAKKFVEGKPDRGAELKRNLLERQADNLRFGEEPAQPKSTALPPPTQTGQGSIYTSTDVLFRLDVAPKYATDFYAARNALASGRNFSDLTPDQREALQATLDQNVLNLIPGTPRSQQLAAISEALYDSGKKPKKGPSKLIPVPEIEFKGRGQSLNELTEEEIRDLAKGYGIYDPDASPDELVLEIDDEGPYADAEESLTNLSMTTIKAIALAYNIPSKGKTKAELISLIEAAEAEEW